MYIKIRQILIISIPLFLKYVFLLIFIDLDLFDIEDLFEDLLFFVSIVVLYTSISEKQFYRDILSFVYLLYLMLETASYIAVSSNFSSSFMYLLLESNTQELSEFSMSYIDAPIILFLIIMLGMFFMIRKYQFSLESKLYRVFSIFGILLIITILKFTGLIESNVYHNIVRGTYGYCDLQKSYQFNSGINQNDVILNSDNEVFVLVLGESTARGHMQLYGYNNETSPCLNRMRDSLHVYNNVISTDVFTLKAVPKIITSQDINSNGESLIHLVELFNVAGFDTYWLSNQRPISYHDNAISKIASSSNWFKFYNHLIDKNAIVLDEVLFPDYERILKKPGKKLIVVRLIGTHFEYDKRYPESFNKFAKEKVGVPKEELIKNHYDNAVMYNDYVVFTFMDLLRSEKSKSALLYISDHGENVYDGTDFFGRSEEVLTKSMFEIPFLLWTSANYEFPNDFIYDSNRSFMADHTYESIGHIFGIKHKSMDFKRSIFSESYQERKRIVLDGIDYDQHFLDED